MNVPKSLLSTIVPAPTSTELEYFSTLWNKVTRPEPYVNVLGDEGMPWSEKTERLEKALALESVGMRLEGTVNKMGYLAPEVSVQIWGAVRDMEDVMPGVTAGARTRWGRLNRMKLQLDSPQWRSWLKNDYLGQLYNTAKVFFYDKYDWVAAGDDKPLEAIDVMNQMAIELVHYMEGLERLEKGWTDVERAKWLDDTAWLQNMTMDEFNAYFQEIEFRGRLLRPFLKVMRVWEHTPRISKSDLQFMSDATLIKCFVDGIGNRTIPDCLLLAFACYTEHYLQVNIDGNPPTQFTTFWKDAGMLVSRVTSGGLSSGRYFRPHANASHKDMALANKPKRRNCSQGSTIDFANFISYTSFEKQLVCMPLAKLL